MLGTRSAAQEGPSFGEVFRWRSLGLRKRLQAIDSGAVTRVYAIGFVAVLTDCGANDKAVIFVCSMDIASRQGLYGVNTVRRYWSKRGERITERVLTF